MNAQVGGTQSIERATELLHLVGCAGDTGARLSELVKESGLAKPTARRLLLALVNAGLLDQDKESRRYYLGPETFVLGRFAQSRFGILPVALSSLVRLSIATGDSAFLSIQHGSHALCLHREEGTYPIRVQVLKAGDRHPLGVGAGSLALLAALSDAEVEWSLKANADELSHKYPTNYSPERLRELVAEAREKGHAFNPGLLLTGSWALGIAIFGHDGRPVGAISVAAIENRLGEERRSKLLPLLQHEAKVIEARLRETNGFL